MFDFGKDLKRLIARGVDGKGRDPRILELLDPDMLAAQARGEAFAAPRATEAWRAWRDVARLWCEHGRRTGFHASLKAAGKAAEQALALAPAGSAYALASVAAGEVLMARHEIHADEAAFDEATAAITRAAEERSGAAALAAVAALHARHAARAALMADDAQAVRAAAALLDAALHGLEQPSAKGDPWTPVLAGEVRLERAGLAAAAGVRWRDARLLDQAGRDLRALIEATDADVLPLTRARAMAACGSALAVLGDLAERSDSIEQAIDLLSGASELFTPDHSPLDAAAILAAQGAALFRLQRRRPAGALLGAAGDLLGVARRLAGARSLRLASEIEILADRVEAEIAAEAGDVVALSERETRLRRRLAEGDAVTDPVAWARGQLALAGVYEALDRLGSHPPRRAAAVLARSEGLEVLREHGLADGLGV